MICVLISGFLQLFAQEYITLQPSDEAWMDSILQEHLTASKLPGMAIGIVGNGQILYAKGFGTKKLGTEDPVTAQSNFHMASVSKTFVATGVAQLVKQGEIQLDDPVTKYLPYFKLRDPRYKEITIQQLITHTSGVPDAHGYHWGRPKHDPSALENYVRRLKKRGLNFAPGTKFKYSNNGFEVLGDVIAKASGMSFEDYMKKHILKPIGMDNSSFIRKEISPALATTPHVKRLKRKVSKIYPYNREHGPSSTLNSNVEDMLKYAITYLNQGSFNGVSVFDTATYQLITKEHRDISDSFHIGLSWFMNPSRWNKEWKMYHHSGEDTGYQSFLGIIPEKSWAIVILYNADWNVSNRRAVFKAAYELAEKYE